MNFVNAQRRAERIVFGALAQPLVVAPLEFFIVPDDRSVLRRRLEEESIRVGFENQMSVGVANFVLVKRTLENTGDEYLPHPRRTKTAHGVHAAIPVVEGT